MAKEKDVTLVSIHGKEIVRSRSVADRMLNWCKVIKKPNLWKEKKKAKGSNENKED